MREFRQTHGRTGERYWRVGLEGKPGRSPDTIITEWGAIEKEKRKSYGETKNKPGSKGAVGTKAFMDEADNAVFGMERLIRKKLEEGYIEVGLDGRPLLGGPIEKPVYEAKEGIPFDKDLPKNLCFSKPRNTISARHLAELEASNNLILTKKVNGMMIIVQLREDESVKVYSRRMEDLTEHFPHLTAAMRNLQLPTSSIMLFEAFHGGGRIKRDLLRTQSVMRSKTERAIQLQKQNGWMYFYLFRIPVWDGVYLEQERTCEECCYGIENSFSDMFAQYRDPDVMGQFLFTVENFDGDVAAAMEEARTHLYEGWVGYKRDAVLGDYSFSLHGKPDRPKACFKLKAEYEDDFIAYWNPEAGSKEFPMGSYGTGKNSGLVGSLSLYQMDPRNNDQVYICEVGSGLTDDMRKKLVSAEYPMVITVKYTSRQYIQDGDPTNALEFPRFYQIHPDKQFAEVYNEKIQRV